MEVSSSNQAYVFLFMVFCGAVCTLVFDVFRAVRRFKRSSGRVVALQDLVFWAIEIFIVYMVAFKLNYAKVRAYEIIALFIGSGVYFVTASEYVIKYLEKLISSLVALFKKVYVPTLRFLRFAISPFARFFCFIKGRIKDFIKQSALKIRQKCVYVYKAFSDRIKSLTIIKSKKAKEDAGEDEILPFAE